jgi:hypothetical protein
MTSLIYKLFKKRKSEHGTHEGTDRGFLVFESTTEVIQAERILKEAGVEVRVMGPPPEVRTGCDLVIEFPLIEELKILRLIQDVGLVPHQVVPVKSPLLKPVDVFKTKDFGQFFMVRAANMKLTLDKETMTIVNISGGGCPDVPYLAAQMVGKTLREVPNPHEIGHTLCGYALKLAYEEMRRRCGSGVEGKRE